MEFEIYNSIDEVPHTISESGKAFIYVIDFGKYVKIGYSESPYSRIKNCNFNNIWKMLDNRYMRRIAVTKNPVLKFRKVEAQIHKLFRKYQVNGQEAFEISFDDCMNTLNKIVYIRYPRNGNIVFEFEDLETPQEEDTTTLEGNADIYISLLRLKIQDLYAEDRLSQEEFDTMMGYADKIAIAILDTKSVLSALNMMTRDLNKKLGV